MTIWFYFFPFATFLGSYLIPYWFRTDQSLLSSTSFSGFFVVNGPTNMEIPFSAFMNSTFDDLGDFVNITVSLGETEDPSAATADQTEEQDTTTSEKTIEGTNDSSNAGNSTATADETASTDISTPDNTTSSSESTTANESSAIIDGTN